MADFTAEELAAEAVTIDTVAPPAVEPPAAPEHPSATQPRADDGKFAAKEGEEGEQRQRTLQVPHQALHGEREAHKATKAELAQTREVLGKLAALREQLQQQPVPETPAVVQPPVTTPPVGEQPPAVDNGLSHLETRLSNIEQQRQQEQRQQNLGQIDEHETRVIWAEVNRADAEFRQVRPDYDEAVAHLVASRSRELARYGVDQSRINQIVTEEALDLARSAIQIGKSPSEMAYEVAQDRGWRGQAAQPAATSADAMLDAIGRGQKQSKSLGGMSGGGSDATISADMVAKMSEGEFAQLYATPEGKRLIDSLG